MYFVLIVTLLCCGAAASWAAVSTPAKAVTYERTGGALLITALLLLGIVLPAVHHIMPG